MKRRRRQLEGKSDERHDQARVKNRFRRLSAQPGRDAFELEVAGDPVNQTDPDRA